MVKIYGGYSNVYIIICQYVHVVGYKNSVGNIFIEFPFAVPKRHLRNSMKIWGSEPEAQNSFRMVYSDVGGPMKRGKFVHVSWNWEFHGISKGCEERGNGISARNIHVEVEIEIVKSSRLRIDGLRKATALLVNLARDYLSLQISKHGSPELSWFQRWRNGKSRTRINMEQTGFPWAKQQYWDGVCNHLAKKSESLQVSYTDWHVEISWTPNLRTYLTYFDIIWRISVCQGVELHRCGPPFWCGTLSREIGRKVLQRLDW